ncbi:MAG: 4-deoxy-4-formamido-L-arabinose-phosphoundecaprenol deformylase [Thermoanaerobaculaceae bacterium]|nr:4-deoxy-4-formamido-L-arabinose-phosphoundecaprenol deformylase [Thermoanaerobaculaceae bacterium]MDI9621976.1 polysaccharide deacetylase family protein [Acidobacteriota bacterium]NLH12805.1 4-deoxy-4-formamido-L-arabinose-phosphoundecaprenol deformylase [Holophagae bacterium]HPW55610.1 polysaccharide deacetylase family protein [Thermoanaerobaculaceae bacterium]
MAGDRPGVHPAPDGRLLGLRIDVDTHDGMRDGVPSLLATLARHKARGTFYLSMGPDRSGLAVRNLLRPGFLAKMRRTRAARLYGWRTVLSGTLLPARPIATAFPVIARRIVEEGHEAGVHAWDHRRWQDSLPRLPACEVVSQLDRGREAFDRIFGTPPKTYAAPAWLTDERALAHQEKLGLTYASDCRGEEPFLPVIAGRTLRTPQVPTTLPTLDEALGGRFESAGAYFDAVLAQALLQPWPVLTIHAETEGGPYAADLDTFLGKATRAGRRSVTLGELLAARLATGTPLPAWQMGYGEIDGRHGRVSQPL